MTETNRMLEFGKVKKCSHTLLQWERKTLVKINVFIPSFIRSFLQLQCMPSFQSSSWLLNRTKDNIPANRPKSMIQNNLYLPTPSFTIGYSKWDLSIETSRPSESWVKWVNTVCSTNNHHVSVSWSEFCQKMKKHVYKCENICPKINFLFISF